MTAPERLYASAIELFLICWFPVMVVLAISALPYLAARWAYARIHAHTWTLSPDATEEALEAAAAPSYR